MVSKSEQDLDAGYKAMAADRLRELESREWIVGIRLKNPSHHDRFLKTEIIEASHGRSNDGVR